MVEVTAVKNGQNVVQGKSESGKLYDWLNSEEFKKALDAEIEEIAHPKAVEPDSVSDSMKIPLSGSRINSLQSFTSAVDWQRQIDNIRQYQNQSKTGLQGSTLTGKSAKDSKIDYDVEFKKYLKNCGCENEEELQALSKVPMPMFCKTKSDLVSFARGQIFMASRMDGPLDISAIVAKSSLADLAEFCQNSSGGDSQKALRELMNKPVSSNNLGNWIQEQERHQMVEERAQFLSKVGTYVPCSLDPQELVHAMSFYENKKINSLSDFQKAFNKQIDNYYEHNKDADKSAQPVYNYKESFDEYMFLQGFRNVSDLQAFNKTDFSTPADMWGAFGKKMEFMTEGLQVNGKALTYNERLLLQSNRSVSDLSDLYRTPEKFGIKAFKQFIEGGSIAGTSMELQQLLASIPSALDALYGELDESTKEAEELKEPGSTSTTESNPKPTANLKKYNSALISNYAS